MPAHARIQQQMSDLKHLADVLGELTDRLPRRAGAATLDAEALATIGIALPRLTATCNALFESIVAASDQGTFAHSSARPEHR